MVIEPFADLCLKDTTPIVDTDHVPTMKTTSPDVTRRITFKLLTDCDIPPSSKRNMLAGWTTYLESLLWLGAQGR